MKTKFNFSFILILMVSASNLLIAQNEPPVKTWSYLVEPYVMFPNMRGDTGVGELPDVTVDASSGDIFHHLQFGAMLYLEASNEKWNYNSDLLYMDLKQDVKSSTLVNDGEVSAKQLGWEVAGLYKVSPWLEVGIGGLLSVIKVDVDIDRNNIDESTTNLRKELSETWFDPMIVAVFKNTLRKKAFYSLRGEVGGFGIGSDFAWQVQGVAGYRFSELFQLQAGYRLIGLDYETGSGSDRFAYDMITQGPVLRFGFNF